MEKLIEALQLKLLESDMENDFHIGYMEAIRDILEWIEENVDD